MRSLLTDLTVASDWFLACSVTLGTIFFTYQSTKYTTQFVNLFDFISDLLFFSPRILALCILKTETLFNIFVFCYFNYL